MKIMINLTADFTVFVYLFGTVMSSTLIRQRGDKIINLKRGSFKGIHVEFPAESNISSVEVYLGVQFASLREGRMRFMPPVSMNRKWTGMREQLSLSDPCEQKIIDWRKLLKSEARWTVEKLYRRMADFNTFSEDCLFVNVYTPTGKHR